MCGGALPEGPYTLGIAHLAGGYPNFAVESFDTATKLALRFADAWLNPVSRIIGMATSMLLARPCTRCLRFDSGKEAANTNLATFLRLTGDLPAGEAVLQRVIDTNQDAVAARINMAANLLHEDRAGGAATGQPIRFQIRQFRTGAFASMDPASNRIIQVGGEACRYLAWIGPDGTSYPAETFGPLPEYKSDPTTPPAQ